MSSLADQIAGFKKNKLNPTTTVVTTMYQIFSTTASVDDAKSGSTASALHSSQTVGVAHTAPGGSATATKPKPLRFNPRANKTLSPAALAANVIRLGFFSSELGPDMRFDRMCQSLASADDRFVMEQIDPAAIESGGLFVTPTATATAAIDSKATTAATALPSKPLRFDCLILPGGSVFEEQASLSDAAAAQLCAYVHAGGGWFGTCAGAFLATSDGFNGAKRERAIVGAATSWARGVGIAECALTSEGEAVFGAEYSAPPTTSTATATAAAPAKSGAVLQRWMFANGPTFNPRAAAAPNRMIGGGSVSVPVPACKVLAYYRTITTPDTNWKFSESAATTKLDDSSYLSYPAAAISGTFGAGRIVCFGPHPEASGLSYVKLIQNSILWIVSSAAAK